MNRETGRGPAPAAVRVDRRARGDRLAHVPLTEAVPAPPPGETAAALQSRIEALDEAVIDLVRLRTDAARALAAQRRTAGLPAVELARENAVLRRYHAAFGRGGAALGLLLTEWGRR